MKDSTPIQELSLTVPITEPITKPETPRPQLRESKRTKTEPVRYINLEQPTPRKTVKKTPGVKKTPDVKKKIKVLLDQKKTPPIFLQVIKHG